MPEWGMIPVPAKLIAQGVTDMVRISDARMSGTSFGTCVLHVSPESAMGGPLGLVRDGDLIELDIDNHSLNFLVNEAELSEYLVRASQRYGMTPDQFIKEVSEAGQITTMVAEVSRAKAIAAVLARVKVVTKSGKAVNLEELAPKQEQPAAAE